MALVGQIGGQRLQAIIRPVERGAADRRCCQLCPPAADAIPGAVIGDAQQHLLPTGARRVARAVQAAEAGGGRQIGQPHGIQRSKQGRQQRAHLRFVALVDVAAGHPLRDCVVAAKCLAEIDHLRDRQSGRTEARGETVALEIVHMRAEADDVAAALPVERKRLRPLTPADRRNSSDTVAIVAGQERFY